MTKKPSRGKRGKGGSAGKGGRLSSSPAGFKSVGKNSGGSIAGGGKPTPKEKAETKSARKARERENYRAVQRKS